MAIIFKVDADELKDGSFLMKDNTDLFQWRSKLPKLENGTEMFSGCTSLYSFSAGNEMCNSLKIGTKMFYNCTKLSSVFGVSVLQNLEDGVSMFENTSITTHNGRYPKLKNGDSMFKNTKMYYYYPYSSDCLQSLESGNEMFRGCYFDSNSVQSILNGIPQGKSVNNVKPKLHIGIQTGAKDTVKSITGLDLTNATNGVDYTISYKNWDVIFTVYESPEGITPTPPPSGNN